MRLIDHEHADAHALEGLDEPGRGEALRRDVEQPHLPPAHARECLAVLAQLALAVDQHRAPGDRAFQPGDLVGHQGDQRRDDDRQLVLAHQRRQLVAERLAGAGRHHDEDVAAGQRGLHDLRCPGGSPRVRSAAGGLRAGRSSGDRR